MIPILLRISGFLSYQETVELDFSSFDLACISGANGAGKSSLLDALTWAIFGIARRKDDALINSHAAAAEVTLEFMYENNRYRVQRAKPREKTGLLEFYVQNGQGGWSTLSERSIRETEARIQHILRLDYETFINASFFLQGKADQFAQQRPGDRKRILSAILGLELWETYREGAAARRKSCEMDLASLDSRLAEIDAELSQEGDRRAHLKQVEENLAQLEKLHQAKESALEGLRRLEASLVDQQNLVQVLQRQWQAAAQRQEQREAHLQSRQAEARSVEDQLAVEPQVRAAYARWLDDRRELERWEELASSFRQYENQRAAPLLIIEKERSALEQERTYLLKRQEQAAGLENQQRQFEAELQALLAEEKQVQAAYAAWQESRARLTELEKLAASYRALENQRNAPWMVIEKARTGLEQEKNSLLLQHRQVQELERQRVTFAQAYSDAQSAITEQRLRLEKRPALEMEQIDLQEKRTRVRTENERLLSEMKVLKERLDRLEETSGVVCPVCGQPLSPAERLALIESLKSEGKENGDLYRANEADIKSTEQAIKLLDTELFSLRSLEQNEHQAQNRRAAGLEERLKQIEAGLDTWTKGGAARLNEISLQLETGAFAEDAHRELAEIDQKMQASGYDPAHHAALRQAELDGRASAEQVQAISRRVATLAEKLKQARAGLAEWNALPAARLAELEAIISRENFALAARQELEKVDQELRSLGYDPAAHAAVRRAEQEGRQTELQLRQLEALQASRAALEREIVGLLAQTQAGEEEVSIQELAFRQAELKYRQAAASLPDIDQVEQEVFDLKEQESRLKMQVGGARQQVEVLKNLKARRKELEQRRAALTLQIARFKQLEKAFSKDGVPALLIEQALPDLETQANEILDRLSGGEMSVRFVTQRDFRDRSRDDKRETLDILISDAAGTREYEMFSGGEAFRVNFAIRLALSRLLAQRAGARLQTLIIDEGFGSQDAEGRQRLIEAINLVRPDFEKVLVITHLEELKEAFPARIEVEKTIKGSTLRVV